MIVNKIQEGDHGDKKVIVYDYTLGLETIATVRIEIIPKYQDKINESVIKQILKDGKESKI